MQGSGATHADRIRYVSAVCRSRSGAKQDRSSSQQDQSAACDNQHHHAQHGSKRQKHNLALAPDQEQQQQPDLELVLHACGCVLYPHLDTASRRCVRLVCKAGRRAVDGSVRRMERHTQLHVADEVEDEDDMYYEMQLPSLNRRRWRCIKEVVVSGQPRHGYRTWEKPTLSLHHPTACLPDKVVSLPPRLEVLKLTSCIDSDGAWCWLMRRLPSLASSLRCLELSHNQQWRRRIEAGTAWVKYWLWNALECLTQLQRLQLSANDMMDLVLDVGPVLAKMQQLRELVIEEDWLHVNLDPEHTCGGRLTSAIAQLSQLQVLHLSTPLSVEVLASTLQGLTNLRDLRFRHLDLDQYDDSDSESEDGFITDLAQVLSAMPELCALGLQCDSALDDLQLVQQLTGLQRLVLQGSKLCSADAAAGLEAALRQLTRLTSLDLSSCDFSRTADPKPLQAAFKQLRLQQLNLSHSQVLCGALAPVLGSQVDLRQLQLVKAAPDAKLLVAALQQLTGLQHLDLSENKLWKYRDRRRRYCPKWCPGFLAALQRMQGLRHLDMGQLGLGDDAAPALAQVGVEVEGPGAAGEAR